MTPTQFQRFIVDAVAEIGPPEKGEPLGRYMNRIAMADCLENYGALLPCAEVVRRSTSVPWRVVRQVETEVGLPPGKKVVPAVVAAFEDELEARAFASSHGLEVSKVE